MDDGKKKFVEFDKWCSSCRFEKNTAVQPPCDDCLEIPARDYSHKPEFWEEKDEK